MEIAAHVSNAPGQHEAAVSTNGSTQATAVTGKPGGGSAVNGGELLILALATCYCNDLYHEAARLGIALDRVEIEAVAEYPGVGLAATDIRYRATVSSPAPAEAIAALLVQTDAVAEVHNTIRAGVPVHWRD